MQFVERKHRPQILGSETIVALILQAALAFQISGHFPDYIYGSRNMTRIREVLDSNAGRDVGYSAEVYVVFYQSIQVNINMLPRLAHSCLLPSFSI
jgi:hypothetical protein